MAIIKVLAGDFLTEKDGSIGNNAIHLHAERVFDDWLGEYEDDGRVCLLFSELESVDVASEESIKKIGGTLGWGAAGAILLGPAGLLAGLLLGGKKKEVTFVARFKDGRKLMATANNKDFIRLQAGAF